MSERKNTRHSLLLPDGAPRSIEETEHASKWPSELNIATVFNEEKYIAIVNSLTQNNQWIVEESNDLLKMLQIN